MAAGSAVALIDFARGNPSRGQTAPPATDALNLLEEIPSALHPAIRRGGFSGDLGAYFDRAARRAVFGARALYVPSGTYTMHTWSPPANLTVLTDGRATVFKQLDTRGKPQRFIEVAAGGVRLWPDGAATIDGGMTGRGTNASQFNSGVRVHANPGVRIENFACGDIYGVDIGGDVLETGCAAAGYLGHCEIGTLYGENVYRNILSVTGGRSGTVAAVIQTGGCGLMAVDFEPDPGSRAPSAWTIGRVVGHRASVVGDPQVPLGSVTIHELDLDYSRPASNPPFSQGRVSAATAVSLFQVGMRYRNVQSIVVDRAKIVGFPRGAVEDIGSGAQDRSCDRVYFGSLEIEDCGVTTKYQVTTQKTVLFEVGTIRAARKTDPSVATFIGGNAMNTIRVNGGEIAGRIVFSAAGGFEANQLTMTGRNQVLFRLMRGPLRLRRAVCIDALVLFDNCSGTIVVEDSRIDAKEVIRASSNPRFIRSTLS